MTGPKTGGRSGEPQLFSSQWLASNLLAGRCKTCSLSTTATSNIHVANSMTYGHCGNNPSEPPPIFNKLAATGAGNGNCGRT